MYGESMLIDQRKELERATGDNNFTETSDGDDMPTTAAPNGRGGAARTSRSGRAVRPPRPRYGDDGDGERSDSSEAQSSGKEWSGDENEPDVSEPEPDFDDEDEDEEMSDQDIEDEQDENTQESLVVQLKYRKGGQVERIAGGNANGVPLRQAEYRSHDPMAMANGANGMANGINGTYSYRPLAPAPPSATGDTIDVGGQGATEDSLHFATRDGTNSAKMDYPAQQAPRPPFEIPVQAMNVS
jgi:hypothetical protein